MGSVVRAGRIRLRAYPSPKMNGGYVDLLVEAFTSTTEIFVRPLRPVPVIFQGKATRTWQIRRFSFPVPHLNGRTVDVLADGCASSDPGGRRRRDLHDHACVATIRGDSGVGAHRDDADRARQRGEHCDREDEVDFLCIPRSGLSSQSDAGSGNGRVRQRSSPSATEADRMNNPCPR